MKRILFPAMAVLMAVALTSCGSVKQSMKQKPFDGVGIVAHRGYWNCEAGGFARNSVAALKAAQDAGFWGSEFDVNMTSDEVLLVFHDPTVQGKRLDAEGVINKITEITYGNYVKKTQDVEAQIPRLSNAIILQVIDRAWINQIDVMSKLRDSIYLRGYAQNNPLQAYVEEGYQLFDDMMSNISKEVVQMCNNLRVLKRKN